MHSPERTVQVGGIEEEVGRAFLHGLDEAVAVLRAVGEDDEPSRSRGARGSGREAQGAGRGARGAKGIDVLTPMEADATPGQPGDKPAMTNVSRNALAQGDVSSFPAPNGYGAESPSVLARRTKLSWRDGTLITSVELAVQ